MPEPESIPWCVWLDDSRATTTTVGGKGASLSRLAQAGMPVPVGFHLTTAAYRHYVTITGIDTQIEAILAGRSPQEPAHMDAAAQQIAALFAEHPVPDAVVTAVGDHYAGLGGDIAVAVRSSATAEDLPEASFAGQMESFLNITGTDNILTAIQQCWASLWTARAIQYRARHHIPTTTVNLAIVIQKLTTATASGVTFTANPVTGERHHIVINATWGLGESLVGGEVTGDNIVIDRATGNVRHRETGDKAVMTVPVAAGTTERAVSPDKRRLPVLSDAEAGELAELAARIEQLYRRPMDIEWTFDGDDFAIVQARPITSLDAGHVREVWNDSLRGDYLWTSTNLGEAVPSVMTPITYSLLRRGIPQAMSMPELPEHRLSGNIGGRFYLNYSFMMASAQAIGLGKLMGRAAELAFGSIPAGMSVPPVPLSRWAMVRKVLPAALRYNRIVRSYQKNLDRRVTEFRARCALARTAVAEATDAAALLAVWDQHCGPLHRDGPRLLAAGTRVNGMALAHFGPWLRRFVDTAEVNVLITGAHGGEHTLDSLGPLVGLYQLANDDIDRETFNSRWGHRCPDELEISVPRPGEDPKWIDRQLAQLADATDVAELLHRQATGRQAAIDRFVAAHPRRAKQLRKRIQLVKRALRAREVTRSESVRCLWPVREWVLRAGEVTGRGDDLFYLNLEEIFEVLRGDQSCLSAVPARRAAYEHYCKLPAYPTYIRGHFDPEAWAADPRRRSDFYDASITIQPLGDSITGTPGSTGTVTGVARLIERVEDADQLAIGEILITKVTNIGWTPVFPRAGAIVTDIGATLSHAAIVARELGIPAVVGCGNATTHLNTGDHIRVNGDTGTIEILQRVN